MTMKFRAHDTFFIRKGWIGKGMKYVALKPDLFVDKSENPMDVLGIGSNMVKALRYWLQALGLTYEPSSGKRVQKFTDLGMKVLKNDPYVEEFGTLLLLQYQLAKQKKDATSWYFFFNEFSMSEFTREEFVQALQNYILMQTGEATVSIRSLNDDFQCIVNTYLPRYKTTQGRVSPENNIDCPLGELGLLDIANKKQRTYKKSFPSAKSINSWIILAVILEQEEGRKEISLNELLTKQCNIGRCFNLDAITMLEVLHELENKSIIKIVRTAGLDIIQINKLYQDYTFGMCIDKYYETINERL